MLCHPLLDYFLPLFLAFSLPKQDFFADVGRSCIWAFTQFGTLIFSLLLIIIRPLRSAVVMGIRSSVK
jgi:hypothetical protein